MPMKPFRSSSGRLPAVSLTTLLLLLPASPGEATGQVPGQAGEAAFEVRVDTIAVGLEHPWGLALLPDGRFLVTERNPGTLRLGGAEGELSGPLDGVPEIFRYEGETGRSQAGLFDVRLHPEFEQNRWVYLSLSAPTPRGAALTVIRGRLVEEAGGEPRLEDVEEIFVMKEDDQDSSGLHFGGSLAFEPGGTHLFLSIGDRRNLERAQDLEDQAGAILRMTEDGEPAPGNPFAGSDEEDPYLWSWGHRNPQGMTTDAATGQLWIVDHGPQRGDGVYRVERGANYGWPLYTEGKDYSGAPLGYEERPSEVAEAAHVFDETVAPSGLVIYRGAAFPEWDGHLLTGGLVTRAVHLLRITGEAEVTEAGRLATELDRRIRNVRVAEDGSIWVITEHEDGEVLRLRPRDTTLPN
ncbi:MAG: PQQ-dependent sugar dehydrogenase [Gemmatimonadales bacterium]|nr:MAG: PQQ-dependent sugar dehydrogenase [Gemmatimonadales bacterium]